MPTLDYLTGFNHRVASLGATQVNGGAVTVDTSTVRHTGGSSLKLLPANVLTSNRYALSAASNIATITAYVNFSSFGTSGGNFLWLSHGTTPAAGVTLSSSLLQLDSLSGGSETFPGTGASVSTDIWYRVELRANATSNPWNIEIQVATADGSATFTDSIQPNFAATTFDSFVLGALLNSADYTMFVTDVAVSLQSADYPIGPIGVQGYVPTAVGTHNLDASTSTFFFTDTSGPPGSAGTAITSAESTSYQMLDEIPLASGTDAVKVTRAPGAPNTPTFRSAGTWSFTANNVATPFTCTPGAPAGKTAGDLLLLVCESRSIVGTVATPSGWNLMTNFPKRSGTASGGSIYLFTRVADGTGTDTPSPVWANLGSTGTSGDASGAGILAYTNATETQDATAVSQDLSAQGSTSTISGITTVTDKSLVVNVAMKLNETSGQTAGVTTYTEDSDNSTTSGTGHIVEVSHLVKTPLGASGSGTITWSGTTSARALIATVALKASTPFTQPTNTWYTEYGFGRVASQPVIPADPYAVRAIIAQELDTATSSTWAAQLYDSVQGSNTEDVSNSSISATAQAFVGKTFAGRPGSLVIASTSSGGTSFGQTSALQEKVAQTFSALASESIAYVTARIAKVASPSDSIVAELWTDSGISPGSLIATSTGVLGSSMGTGFTVTGTYYFTGASVVAGTTYWLVFRRTGALDNSNKYSMSFDNSNPYASGHAWGINQGTSDWFDLSAPNGDFNVAVGSGWTLAALAGTRLRFGYTAAATGDPRLAAAMLEAAFPPAAPPDLGLGLIVT